MGMSTSQKNRNTAYGIAIVVLAIVCFCCLLPWYFNNFPKSEVNTETYVTSTTLPLIIKPPVEDLELPSFTMGTSDPKSTPIPTSPGHSELNLPTLSTTKIVVNPVVVLPNTQEQTTISIPNNTNNSAYFGGQTKTSGCRVNGPYPDPACTPGSVFADATKDRVCVSGYSSMVRDVSDSDKDKIYRMYGISRNSADYEVDHFIPLELGGNNDSANLFPEIAQPSPGYHEKDRVENYLHDEVCDGRMTLQQAQQAIASDWVAVYKQMGGVVTGSKAPAVPILIPTNPPTTGTIPLVKCNDGYQYHPVHRQGACSGHKGIAPGY